MTEATTADTDTATRSTETLLNTLTDTFPGTIDSATITLTENLVTQFRNEHPESNRGVEAVTLGCFSIILRQMNAYVPDRNICDAFWDALHNENDRLLTDTSFRPITQKELRRARRHVCNELSVPIEPTRPADHADRARQSSDIPSDVVDDALDFINRVPGEVYSGCKPSCVLAGAIYTVGTYRPDIEITQQNLADALDISQAGVRSQFQTLAGTDVCPCP